MNILIDSDQFIFFLRDRPEYIRKLRSLIHRLDVYTSVIVIAELYDGFYRNPARSKRHIDIFEKLLEGVEVIPVNRVVGIEFGRLRSATYKKGITIDDMDLLIAATCLVNNCALVTDNIKHFQKIPGLKLFDE